MRSIDGDLDGYGVVRHPVTFCTVGCHYRAVQRASEVSLAPIRLRWDSKLVQDRSAYVTSWRPLLRTTPSCTDPVTGIPVFLWLSLEVEEATVSSFCPVGE